MIEERGRMIVEQGRIEAYVCMYVCMMRQICGDEFVDEFS
jgi:hypothetical protein